MNVTSIAIEVVIYDYNQTMDIIIDSCLYSQVQVRVTVFSILTVLTILCTHGFCGGILNFGVGTKALC